MNESTRNFSRHVYMEVHGGVEVPANGAAAGCPDEQWCARSTRLRGQAVRSSVLMSTFLMCVVGYSFLDELPFAG
jgi:hypothetical protein